MTRQQDLEELFAVVDKLRGNAPQEENLIPERTGVYVPHRLRGTPELGLLAVNTRYGWKLGGEGISLEGLRHWLQNNNITLVKLEAVE